MAGRRRKTSPWIQLPLWGMVVLLVGWGLWQATEFRRSLMAEVRLNDARSQPAAETESPANTLTDTTAIALAAPIPDSPIAQPLEPDARTFAETDPLPESPTNIGVWEEHPVRFTPPAPGTTQTPDELFAQGVDLLNTGRIVEGRDALNAILSQTTDEAKAAKVRQILSDLNASVFLGSALLPDDPAARYVNIQTGDSFLKLGKAYGVPAAYLQAINPSLNPRNLKPLTGVKIVRGPFALRLIKHASRLDLYLRDLYVRSFTITLPEGNYLPRGEYRIASGTKLQLSNRTWIGFEGLDPTNADVISGWLYGTAGPRGTNARDRSSGIRMADTDLQQLYNVLLETRSHLRVEP